MLGSTRVRKELFNILSSGESCVKLFLVKFGNHISHSLISHPNNESEMTQITCRIVEAYGGHVNFFRLVKLLYVIEHESWEKLNQPAMGGEYFSLWDGPMISETSDAPKPENAEKFKIWWKHLKSTPYGKGSEVTIVKPAGRDEISDALLGIVDAVIVKTRYWTNDQLKTCVHDVKNFKEYQQPPKGSRLPIEAETILAGVGKSPQKIKKLQSESEQWRMFEAALA